MDHDPSMALYRIQEHTNKVAPKLVVRYERIKWIFLKINLFLRRQQMSQLNSQIQGACFDLDNAIKLFYWIKLKF